MITVMVIVSSLLSLTQPSDEEEIVDLLLENICSLFGIRYKGTKDARGPEVNEEAGATPTRSSNTPNNA